MKGREKPLEVAFVPEVAYVLLIFLMKWRLYLWDRKKRLIRIEGKTKKALMERFVQYANTTGYVRVTPPHWHSMNGGGYYRPFNGRWWRMSGGNFTRYADGRIYVSLPTLVYPVSRSTKVLWFHVTFRQAILSRVK